ncbi:MAG: ABC transporter ATP-binding protein, partial [Anaerolineae bacterium]|nr:ABC transporter ATP-binding protein [Anaerolineae bacterium]
LVGESGSGKSTLLRVAAGLIRPEAGQVTFNSPERPQMVYQDAAASLTPWLSVAELIGERLRPLGLSRVARRERVNEALELVGLSPHLATATPGQLSGGQAQRVAIARAVVIPPRLLLCDEPVSALDVSLAAAILNLLGSLRRRLGMAMLFVTHDLAAARFVADRIVVMKAGKIVEVGPAEQIAHTPQAAYTQELLAAMPDNLLGAW